jgi:hypothetical protein
MRLTVLDGGHLVRGPNCFLGGSVHTGTSPASWPQLAGKKVKIGSSAVQKSSVVFQEKRFRAPTPTLLVAAVLVAALSGAALPEAVAVCGPAVAGLAAPAFVVVSVAAVAVRGPLSLSLGWRGRRLLWLPPAIR